MKRATLQAVLAAIVAFAVGALGTASLLREAAQQAVAEWEVRYLTQDLAQNTIELDILRKLGDGQVEAIARALEFELDARVLVLDELLREAPDGAAVRAKRALIECHLSLIKKHRSSGEHAEGDPEIAAMVRHALARATDCRSGGAA